MSETKETHLLLYRYVDSMINRRVPHRNDHLAHLAKAREAGHVVIAGAFGEPPLGAVLGFTGISHADVEAFVAADPYVVAGLVTEHEIHPWNIV